MKISKPLKICGGVTAFLIITLSITIVVLWFTILKPKQPKITTQEVTLKHINLVIDPSFQLLLNITIGLLLTVHNPNHASFNYGNTTAYLTYRGSSAAEVPIPHDTIPARGDHDIATDAILDMNSLVDNDGFLADVEAGCLNFTSSTTLHGRAKVINLFKVKATVYSTCHISVYIFHQNSSFVCNSKAKF